MAAGPKRISQRYWRCPGDGTHGHIFISLLVQGERGIPGRKGVKGQKGEPGPPGLDQPCPVVRVRARTVPQPRSLPPPANIFPVLRVYLQARGHAGPALECSHCQGHRRCYSRHRGSSCSVLPWVQLGVPTAFIKREAQPGQSVCWDHCLSLLSFLGHGGGADRPYVSGGPTLSPCLSSTCPTRPLSSLLPAAFSFPALSPQSMRAPPTQCLK